MQIQGEAEQVCVCEEMNVCNVITVPLQHTSSAGSALLVSCVEFVLHWCHVLGWTPPLTRGQLGLGLQPVQDKAD